MTQLPQATAALQAVLFDLDGLLVDTEPLWFRAETAVVTSLGGDWGKPHQQALLGTNLAYAADYMVRHTGTELSVLEVAAMLRAAMSAELTRGAELRPGAAGLVAELRALGVPMALVTSSVRDHVDAVVGSLPPGAFQVTVTGDDVTNLKPHPEPYLRALDLLQADPGRTVVLEDSPAGVSAAEAAGCRVVAVPSVVPIEPRDGRHVVASLTEVDVGLLAGLVTRW